MPADVTLVSTYPPSGVRHGGASGVASYTANLAHGLAGEGARVAVIAPEASGEPMFSNDGPVSVRRCFRRGPNALPAAARAAEATGAPVVHLQHEVFLFGGTTAIPGLVAALRRLRRSCGLVVTLHQVVDPTAVDSDFTRLHRVRVPAPVARTALGTLQTTVRRMAHRVIVHEPGFAPVVAGADVIPHGVESRPTPSRRAACERLGLDRDRLNALCFGFLAPYKGIETALRAATIAGDRTRLIVAGGEHPRLSGRDQYAEHLRRRWGGTARFVGYVPDADVADWFAAADVALYPYPRPFSSSGALALALAQRTPVLLSPALAATTGAPSGLIASEDPDALAAQLTGLADRPERRERLAFDAAVMAQHRTWPEIAARHLELYGEVCDVDGPAGRRLRAG